MDAPQETGVNVFLLPEIKMEKEESVDLESEDENKREMFQRSRGKDPKRVKRGPAEGPSKNWDAKLEEFLKTLQPVCSEGETSQTPEEEQQKDSITLEEPNKQASKLYVSPKTRPHLVGGIQLAYRAHLDASSYGKKREKDLAGDAARLEMRRQRFRTLCYQDADGPREFCQQLQQQCREWLNPDRNTKERMVELVTLEQFLAVVPAEMLSYLWENGPVTCAKAVALAEDFLWSQQRDRDIKEQDLSDTEEMHETKQEDKASANLLASNENPLLDRPEKMPAFLKTENENNFLYQGETETGQQKTDWQNGNATEVKRDLFVDPHDGCKSGDESTIQQDVNIPPMHESSLELEKRYKCWHCGQSFSSSSDLLSHERNHVGEQLYKCSHCGGSERIHMGRKPRKCSHCRNTFGCNPEEETDGGNKFHTCGECGEKYMHKSSLLKHQGVHRGEKPYKCLKCGENFGNFSKFRTHCRTHTGEKQYKCLQCDISFSSITRLKTHERNHVAVCSCCGKSFRKKSDLIEHQRIHAKEDAIVCFDCGKIFKSNAELMAHVRTYKDKKLECPDTKRTLICSECGDSFKYVSAFKTHQRVHRGEHRKDLQDQEECFEGPIEIKMETEEDEQTEEPRKRQRLTEEIRSQAAAVFEPEEESASETEVTDEQPQPQCNQDFLENDSEKQLMKAAAPEQQVPKKAMTFVSQKGRKFVVQYKYRLPLIKRICSGSSEASSVKQHLKKAQLDKLNTVLETTGDRRPVPSEEPVRFDREEDDTADVRGPPAVRARKSGKQNVTQKILDRTLMDYITEELVPLQTVDKPTFLALVRLGLPKNLTVMSAKTLRDRIEKRAAGLRESLASRMSAVSHVATVAYCQTDGKRTFLGVTAHWISPITLKREFGALTYKRLKGPLTYSILAKALHEIHTQYGIRDKVVYVTADNGSNFMDAFQGFGAKEPVESSSEEDEDEYEVNQDESGMEFLPLSEVLETGKLTNEIAPESDLSLPPHHRCASYTLNLVATHDVAAMIAGSTQDGPFGPFQKHFCTLARKCRKLWSKQKNSVLVAKYIYEQCGTYLTVPNWMQWNSVFDALKQLNRLLSTMPLKVDAIMDMCSLARITADERLVLQEYTEIMGPLALSLDILQRENGMFMGYLLPTLYSLKYKLQELENKPVPYTYCLPLLRGIQEAIKKRFADIWEDGKLLLAACLHPRFKTDWLNSAQTTKINRSTVEALLKAELKGAVTGESSEKYQEGDDSSLDFFDIQPQQGRSVVDPVEEEISKYLKTPNRELSSLLAFPGIWRSFLKFNTGIPSSAVAENLICRDGSIVAAKRHSLPDNIFEDLVLLKQNSILSTFQAAKHSSA